MPAHPENVDFAALCETSEAIFKDFTPESTIARLIASLIAVFFGDSVRCLGGAAAGRSAACGTFLVRGTNARGSEDTFRRVVTGAREMTSL